MAPGGPQGLCISIIFQGASSLGAGLFPAPYRYREQPHGKGGPHWPLISTPLQALIGPHFPQVFISLAMVLGPELGCVTVMISAFCKASGTQ